MLENVENGGTQMISPLFKKLVNGNCFGEIITVHAAVGKGKSRVFPEPEVTETKVPESKDPQYMVIRKGKVMGWETI